MTFKDQVTIITGASSGIGAELARQLAAGGARLALAARRAELLEEVAADCRQLGGQAVAVPTDITLPEQCAALVQRTVDSYGAIDMLINNAGISMHALFTDIEDLTIFERIMRVNYLGAVACTHYALPHLLKARGRIVVVSSLTGKAGVPTRTGYAASKHALHGFFDSLRVELAGSGVSVTIACPSFVDTGIRRYQAGAGDSRRNIRSKRMPVERCARIILRAAQRRRREVVMTALGKVGRLVRPFLPGLIDWVARKKVGLS
ncbi:MAG: SDR family oxidoreductase [Candidatus Marinimicrobia bacterium]|nr:SDR family oxidoreductase [Candidatus Neomarinimicrobiota bacterium]